jgi:hypothetical protein
VVFFVDSLSSQAIGEATLVDGVATLTITLSTSVTPGPHLFYAVYTGNGTFEPSQSIASTATVAAANTTSTLVLSVDGVVQSSPASMDGDSALGLTCVISPVPPATAAPNGAGQTVSFYDYAVLVIGAGNVPVINGVASVVLDPPVLASGLHSITAVYAGSSQFNTSTSAPPFFLTIF